ncbi:TetR/AcrR family transcriptional regulator [Phytohabitans sp. ZYX-F-186]|uniref:TetR/AcrR family transcriptional regulator n=1 Tax=Phytohabitans maris TaxID=3071409 RepID=A0ABU0ZHI7_9ACTN|nr:TetR/AcrR family transcriptional regulator [Phytohabitans sp. ZYX-F-186]MDQ7905750.1 TetR/AcrR family transcriptional regulator [Phytohabitans sp. ZYX-F-186]
MAGDVKLDVPDDRRQRRWRQLHDSIYEAARELFLENGFSSTSVDDIAVRADVARKTAFNHYPRKRDFIREWGERRRNRVHQRLSRSVLAEPQLAVVLRHYFDELAKLNVEDRALTRRMLMGWRECGGPFDADPHALIGVFAGLLRAAADRGELTATVDPDRIATVLYSSYFGLLYDWCEGTDEEPPFDLQVAFMQFLDVVLSGLGVRS